MTDIKTLLLTLGEILVKEHDFSPTSKNKTTEPLFKFLVWIDKNPEVREELSKMGYSFRRGIYAETSNHC